MNLRQIVPISDDSVERKSSIYQHSDLLSVMKHGEWCPILFDKVDGIHCGKLLKHKVAIRLRGNRNYTYPVGTQQYIKNTYFITQKDKTELRELPEYYGTGFYETHERKNMFTNIGKEAFGLKQTKTLRVGKDYIEATKTLKAIE